jgi:hypothetical protein
MRHRSFHPRSRSGPLLAAVTLLTGLILAGCGGSASEKLQVVSGEGFQFQAPSDWNVSRVARGVAAASGPVNLVQAQHFVLVKPYRPALFGKTIRELNGTASRLAQQNAGHVAASATRKIAGRKSRYYRIDFGPGKSEEIAFVLIGKDEYYLLCRRSSDASDADCTRFFSTFVFD